MIARQTLQNGAKIVMESVPHTRTVSIGFWFLQGSRDETAAELGMSHFLEHMMFKGTENLSALEIVKTIDRVGGVLNAFTEKEQTCFYCTIASRHTSLAVRLLSEMTFRSVLPEEEISRERNVIQNEIDEIEDIPEEKAYDLFLRNMWGDHPLANRITGETETIHNFNRENLFEFYKKWYVPENLIISIAGDIRFDTVISILEDELPGTRLRKTQAERSHPVRIVSEEYISSHFQQVQIITGTAFAIPNSIEEFYHFLVFSTIFGESMSSRLFQAVREQLGLCYSIQAMRTYFSSTALWSVYANTSPALLNKLLRALNSEFSLLFKKPPDETELNDAVSHLSGGLILSLEDMEVRMKRMVRHYLLGGEIHNADVSIGLLEAITIDDINNIIENYIQSGDFNLLVFGTRNLDKRKKTSIQF